MSETAKNNRAIINNVATAPEISTTIIAPKNIIIISRQTNRALPVESQMPIEMRKLLLANFAIAALARIWSSPVAL